MIDDMDTTARDLFLRRFSWIDGHADIWPAFGDPETFDALVGALVDPFRASGVTAVCGIESRGFLLGGAAALRLGVGFVPVRKAGGVFPGDKVEQNTAADYRGIRQILRIQRSSITWRDRVLLVDDWIETGSQALAVRELITAQGAALVGCAVIVDQMGDHPTLGTVHSVVTYQDLPAWPAPVGDM
jgi:adenine phosphoribosyltransferase